MSNVMIFNCTAIDNSTLKSMEPIVSFVSRMPHIKSKPVFRVRDYGLDAPITMMLVKTMETQDDQYQTIRSGLKHLFHPNHRNIIMMTISDADKHLTQEYLTNVVDSIKSDAIDAKRLDISLLILKNDIQGFINNINKRQQIQYQREGIHNP